MRGPSFLLPIFRREMQFRHLGFYPPYAYLCTIIYMDKDLQTVMQVAQEAKEFLGDMKVLGPVLISMRQAKQRVRLVVKSKSKAELNQRIWALAKHHQALHTKVYQDINMYPMTLED